MIAPTKEYVDPLAGVAAKVVHADGLISHYAHGERVQVEVVPSRRTIAGMSCAGPDDAVSFHHLSDAGLDRLATVYRRKIEDGITSDGTSPHGFAYLLRWVTALQRVRFRLRMRYGARDAYGLGDRGTDVYDHWYRLGEPPSYALAFQIDRGLAQRGRLVMDPLSCAVNALAAACRQSGKAPEEFDALNTWVALGDAIVLAELRPVLSYFAPPVPA